MMEICCALKSLESTEYRSILTHIHLKGLLSLQMCFIPPVWYICCVRRQQWLVIGNIHFHVCVCVCEKWYYATLSRKKQQQQHNKIEAACTKPMHNNSLNIYFKWMVISLENPHGSLLWALSHSLLAQSLTPIQKKFNYTSAFIQWKKECF